MNSKALSTSDIDVNDSLSGKTEIVSFLPAQNKSSPEHSVMFAVANKSVFSYSSFLETTVTDTNASTVLNVMIVGNEPLAVLSLEKIIRDIEPYSRLVQSVSIADAIDKMAFVKPSFLIVDITNNEAVSLSLIKLILNNSPKIKILIISDVDENIFAIPYFQTGAQGFISKYASTEDFRLAITTLLNQQKYFSESVMQMIIRKSLSDKKWSSNPLTNLSVRENQVLNFLIEKRAAIEIAAILGVTGNTVGTYKRRIFSKLNVTNLRELLEKVKLLK